MPAWPGHATGDADGADDDAPEDVGPDWRSFDFDPDLLVVPPRQADEFACAGCFLLKRQELLADPAGLLCRDCAA